MNFSLFRSKILRINLLSLVKVINLKIYKRGVSEKVSISEVELRLRKNAWSKYREYSGVDFNGISGDWQCVLDNSKETK